MQLEQIIRVLNLNKNATPQFILPSGSHVPAHFHLTEVGRVEKSFIDCGGTVRSATTCLLQLWVANDVEHRLQCEKFANIIAMAEPLLKSTEMEVEVEYGKDVAATYSIDHAVASFGTIQFFLAGKQTDCLAKEKCGIDSATGASCC